jgi:flagellar basal body P-ring protein FlgI
MRDIVKLTGEMQNRISDELDGLVNERSTARAILESRSVELAKLRDAEIRRVEQWAEQQKAMINEVFGAIIAENAADIERCDIAIARLGGEVKPVSVSRPALRTVGKAAAAYAKAAE